MSVHGNDQGTIIAQGSAPGVAELSERQHECLSRAGEGMSSKEIGRLLGISPSTVDNHIHAAISKLNAKNRWQAAQLLQPVRDQNGSDHRHSHPLVPPLGGSKNSTPAYRRLAQILAIAVISIIVVSSAIVLILGAVDVFALR